MNITATAVAVTLAVVVAVAFLFLGPSVLRPFGHATTATTTDAASQNTMASSSDSLDISGHPVQSGSSAQAPTTAHGGPIQGPLPTTLTVSDEVVGTGATAKAGDVLTMNYVGMLPDGTVFDASAKHGQAFQFQLGAGQVIKGWDQGLVGMKVGGKRKLVIPPDFGYGAQGAGGVIPPNATLIFEVELVKIGQ